MRTTDKPVSNPGAPPKAPGDLPIEEIRTAVGSVRHGVVQLIIQDGKVVQIDKTEKIRLV
jgi:hypothetical protein